MFIGETHRLERAKLASAFAHGLRHGVARDEQDGEKDRAEHGDHDCADVADLLREARGHRAFRLGLGFVRGVGKFPVDLLRNLRGLVGILRGNSTGFEWLEMPRQAQVILLVAFTVIAVLALVTHQNREERGLYPSQWFVLAAFFWFPWIFSTAHLLLLEFPVRGIVQSSIAWWFSGNLLNVWLALAGLASTFYILPKLVGRPLQSGHIALFVFATLILFGSWTGIPASAPLPAWMTALSGAAGVLALVPALGVATIVLLTRRGTKTQCMGGPLCYF